ncbi:uncharacterized protein N7479_007444 [Penicillium vulpinum]|uniref:uncharacterized protein n=1 Tax=Penicillium vulpinum TaxID=29845 RepID=UPI0025479F75|nr:uncharacterized protein N7479_007444 [Penicillium vulpinum]KAJ5960294.1 hypothetical protein N7479_007444 [Penicillium vulpinum]
MEGKFLLGEEYLKWNLEAVTAGVVKSRDEEKVRVPNMGKGSAANGGLANDSAIGSADITET